MADRRESVIFSSARSITVNRALSLPEANPAIRSIRLSHLWRRELRRNRGVYMRCISYIPVILLHRQNCHSLILCVWSWVSTVKNLVNQVHEIGLKFGIWFDPGMLYYSPQIWCSDDTRSSA